MDFHGFPVIYMQNGTGLDGTGLDGTGLDGTGRDGTGRDWTGLDGTGLGDFTNLETQKRPNTEPQGVPEALETLIR